jgi:hypothetical protein
MGWTCGTYWEEKRLRNFRERPRWKHNIRMDRKEIYLGGGGGGGGGLD